MVCERKDSSKNTGGFAQTRQVYEFGRQRNLLVT
jgi:hypothetical protein